MDENEVYSMLQSKGLQFSYERVVEKLASMDGKAQSMIGLEGLLLALIAVFSNTIPQNQSIRTATWAAMIVLLLSALCSLMVLRIRYGSRLISQAPTVEEGLDKFRKRRDYKPKWHHAALALLAIGLFGLVVVLSLILL